MHASTITWASISLGMHDLTETSALRRQKSLYGTFADTDIAKEALHMSRQAEDEAPEERIHMEIIVDAYGPEEQATSSYYYPAENLHFPFSARIVRCPTSPLKL
jgi:hypothetical protein